MPYFDNTAFLEISTIPGIGTLSRSSKDEQIRDYLIFLDSMKDYDDTIEHLNILTKSKMRMKGEDLKDIQKEIDDLSITAETQKNNINQFLCSSECIKAQTTQVDDKGNPIVDASLYMGIDGKLHDVVDNNNLDTNLLAAVNNWQEMMNAFSFGSKYRDPYIRDKLHIFDPSDNDNVDDYLANTENLLFRGENNRDFGIQTN